MLSAIWKRILVIITFGTYKINKGTNDMYTNSVDGIRTGYSDARDQLVDQISELIEGVSGIENLKIEKENRLEKLDKEEEEIEESLEGILSVLDNDPENVEVNNDYDTLADRKDDIDSTQDTLTEEIKSLTERLTDYDLQIKKYKDQIHALKQDEEEAVSDHALLKLEEDLLERETGLKKSVDMSGVDAIQEARRKRKAKVSTLRRASGSDTEKRMDKYKSKGRSSKRDEEKKAMLAERAAKKAAEKAGSTESTSKIAESERKV